MPVQPRGRPVCPLGGGDHHPPCREKGAVAPEAPEVWAPIAQEGAEEGGTEVEMQEEEGSAQNGEGMETWE